MTNTRLRSCRSRLTRTCVLACVLCVAGFGSSPVGAAPGGDAPAPQIANTSSNGPWDSAVVRASLLAGVTEIGAPGVPGPLAVFGDRATTIVGGEFRGVRAPVVAAAALDSGRVVAFGHTGYLDRGTLSVGQTGVLMRNSIAWAGGDTGTRAGERSRLTVGLVNLDTLGAWVTEQGFDVRQLKGARLSAEAIKGCDVIALGQGALSEPASSALREHVRRGGGLIMAGLGWGWLQLNDGKRLSEHPGNRLLAGAGIAWADGSLDRTSNNGFLATDDASLEALNALAGLEVLLAQEQPSPPLENGAKRPKLKGKELARVKQATVAVELGAKAAPRDDRSLAPRLERLLAERGDGLAPSKESPLDWSRGLDRVILALQLTRMEGLKASEVRAHRSSATFLGLVGKDVPRVQRQMTFDTSADGWRGTGLYAPPGEVIRFSVTPAAAKLGLRAQIGCHTDENWHHDSWDRAPQIVVSAAINAESIELASAFGGPIYVVMPDGGAVGTGPVTIGGGIESPRFVLGVTSESDWKIQRALAGAWAELESGKIILTLPSDAIRELDDPTRLMAWWNRVSDATADLATIDRDRKRPERYVADVQISAGYMHSGYPIMTHLDAAAHMTNAADLERGVNAWGLLHELGHNHQSDLWTFEGTGEVTVNLFTMHALEKVCGVPVGGGWWWKEDDRQRLTAKHLLKDKADFGKWKSDPSTALIMYIQLQRAFGWEAFTKVFSEYRQIARGEQPATQPQKRDQWLVRFSRVAGHDLGDFFQAWGVPTSDEARASIKDLPRWMPDGFPPVSDKPGAK